MSFWGRRKLIVAAGAASGIYWYSLPSEHPIRRTARTTLTMTTVGLDYKSLKWRGLWDDEEKVAQTHMRNAKRVLDLCLQQGGIYTKMGQHVATVGRSISTEYVESLSKLKDRAKNDSFEDVRRTIEEEFGEKLEVLFSSFEPEPIASASLAQVHHARLRQDGTEVAVKVQHPRVRKAVDSDLRTFRIISDVIVPFFFEGVELGWIVSEFERNLAMELDFRIEANSATRALHAFRDDLVIKIPEVYPDLTSTRVLTMEFIRGVKIEDLHLIPSVSPSRVAAALEQAFAQMVFVDGFVHGDPHSGNLLVTPNERARYGFNLVLLDHGLYRELDDNFRLSYCLLWKSIISRNIKGVEEAVKNMGVPGAADIFTVAIASRPTSELNRPDVGNDNKLPEGEKRKHGMDSEWGAKEVSNFMESLPRDFLIVVKTGNIIRSITRSLGEEGNRFLVNGRYAVRGMHREEKAPFELWSDLAKLEISIFGFNAIFNGYKLLSRVQGLIRKDQSLSATNQPILD